MKFILTLTLSLLLSALSACASSPSGVTDSSLYGVPVGSIIKLNQALTVPRGKVRAGVQYGKPSVSVNQYEPYCEFHVNTILESNAILPAGDYRVTKVRRFEFPIAGDQKNGGNMVASSSEATAWAVVSVISPARDWLYTTSLYLESEAYPDIRMLQCGNAFPAGYMMDHHVTLDEFEMTVGDIIMIQAGAK